MRSAAALFFSGVLSLIATPVLYYLLIEVHARPLRALQQPSAPRQS